MAVENHFSTVSRILAMQVLMAIVVASGFFVSGGFEGAKSPLLGSLVALIPNGYFAWKIYLSRNKGAKKIVRAFYSGETAKLILTAALFAVIFQIPGVNLLAVLAGYVAVSSVFWLALLLWRD
ncbi:ATP synthase subunit I [methane-oxidizing endosymbiont of Gigantopelta aegis]|uniref:ATP synthase subunit I n=1 Tax=methane-oxidizing endosymbiont of Gigantopelta aegis TaxID=2794938 RepID=UPI0018DEA4ED|nr:ATP synthase subunit I [methane-oxidizing endosymbiont of Gigantopelta aegis]